MKKVKKNINQFIENIISLFSAKISDLLLAILLIPYLILKVGIENYGRYVFALSLILFLINVINYGFDLSAVRELAKNSNKPKKQMKLLNKVFSVKLYLAILMLLVLFVLVFTIPRLRIDRLMYCFAVFLIIGDLFSLRWFFMGIEKMKYIPIINTGGKLIFISLVVLFIKQPEDYEVIILLEGVGLFIVNVFSFIYIIRKNKIKIKLSSFNNVKKYLYNNWNSFINLFIPSMLSNISVFIVGLLGTPIDVSIIELAVKVTSAFSTLNAILTKVFYVMVNRKIQIMRKSFSALTIIGLTLSFSMFFSAEVLVETWLKVKDSEIQQNIFYLIKFLSPIPFFISVISAYGINGLLVRKKDVIFKKITLISFFTGLFITLALNPKYPFKAGAIFLIITRGVYAIGSFILFKKEFSLTVKKR